jgi:hypothetical protein
VSRARKALILVAALGLLLAGAGTAAVLTRTITLHAGHCITLAKTRVCAAKQKTITKRVNVPGPTVTATATVTAPPPPPAVAFKDGTYRVGVDIVPGTYQEVTVTGECYWARFSGFSGEFGDIIANSFNGQSIVTIAATDAGFSSQNCGSWTKVG